jgi:hypothetical protein
VTPSTDNGATGSPLADGLAAAEADSVVEAAALLAGALLAGALLAAALLAAGAEDAAPSEEEPPQAVSSRARAAVPVSVAGQREMSTRQP